MAASAMVLHMSHECSSSHSPSLSYILSVRPRAADANGKNESAVCHFMKCLYVQLQLQRGTEKGQGQDSRGLWHREGGTDRTTLTLAELQNAPQLIISKCVKSHAAHTHSLSMCASVCVMLSVCESDLLCQ